MSNHSVQEVHLPVVTPFSKRFLDANNRASRVIYLKIFLSGCFLIVITIFAAFPIYWGALSNSPVRNLCGWVVDFDGGAVGQAVVQGLTAGSSSSQVTWTSVSASQFPGGLAQLSNAVVEQETWVAVSINKGVTARLAAAYTIPNASYNGSDAITVYADEARNEVAFRNLIRPSVETALRNISESFALQSVKQLVASPILISLLTTSPQTILAPISYTTLNLTPFDIPVASAVTFVGLIYQYILSFFVVIYAYSAREVSELNKSLTLRSLILVRYASAFWAYFIISLFYALLTLAFQLDFTRKFGQSGFVIFWMLNWAEMLAVGLALEALIALLTPRLIPFFLILWVISNVAVSVMPLEVLPDVYRYGYAAPFYNTSHAIRCIVFRTKNTLGINFAVLITWVCISCVTLPLIQWYVRSKDAMQSSRALSQVVGQEKNEKRDV